MKEHILNNLMLIARSAPVLILYLIAHYYSKSSLSNPRKIYINALGWCLSIAFGGAYLLGMESSEDYEWEPLSIGSGLSTEFIPTFEQRLEAGVGLFLFLIIPVMLGVVIALNSHPESIHYEKNELDHD